MKSTGSGPRLTHVARVPADGPGRGLCTNHLKRAPSGLRGLASRGVGFGAFSERTRVKVCVGVGTGEGRSQEKLRRPGTTTSRGPVGVEGPVQGTEMSNVRVLLSTGLRRVSSEGRRKDRGVREGGVTPPRVPPPVLWCLPDTLRMSTPVRTRPSPRVRHRL